MTCIVPNILTLFQYFQTTISQLKPESCPNCGWHRLWNHGKYNRKVGRSDKDYSSTLIPIYRFICTNCYKTCSVLPECVPPKRWYLWCLQQLIILHISTGGSLNAASHISLPHRSTCKRWWNHLLKKFQEHTHIIQAQFPRLGRFVSNIHIFWSQCLEQMSFDKAMFICHQHGVTVP